MKTLLPSFAGAALIMLAAGPSASGESATFGFQTTTGRGAYVTGVYMRGPIARNKVPEKNGVFKGEFVTRAGEWQSKLTAVYKLSLDKNGELHSQKVEFTAASPSDTDAVETNGWKGVKMHFATAHISFESQESFLLVFKNKIATRDGMKEETEMVMVSIVSLFVPS